MAIINLHTGYNCEAFHYRAAIAAHFKSLTTGLKTSYGLITLEYNGDEDEEQWTVRCKTTKKDLREVIARINTDQGTPVNDLDLDDQVESVWAGEYE